ncbi:MAG: TlpA disulfide reductase family protein [Sediminibacterium sp.]|nr:TlpA disulfide reductase family protein [Sediminibacterium sp.]
MTKILTRQFIFFVFIFYSFELLAQQPFSLIGQIKNMNGSTLYLVYYLGKDRVADSCVVNDNKFRFNGSLQVPVRASLSFRNRVTNERRQTSIFLEPTSMKVVVNSENIRDRHVIGSNSHILERRLEDMLYDIYGKYNDQYLVAKVKIDSNKNDLILKKKVRRLDSLSNAGAGKIPLIIKRFILDYSDSYVSANEVYFYKDFWTTDTVSKYFSALSSKMQNSFYGVETKYHLLKSIRVGMPANDFSIIDVNSENLHLADFKGKKYVLLDFWASWCAPCIAEFPDLKFFYEANNKDVEIIGLSNDEDTLAWKNALAKYRLPWRQAIIGLAPENDKLNKSHLDNLYIGISTIPRQFLIDKNGVVIGIFNSAPLDMDKLRNLIK